MYFKFACPSCGKNLKVPEEAGGKRARCPYCKNQVMVPKFTPADIPDARPKIKDPTDELAAAASAMSGPAAPRRASTPTAAAPAMPKHDPAMSTSSIENLTQSGADGTNVSAWLTAAIAAGLTVVSYLIIWPLHTTYLGTILTDGGWVNYAEVFLMYWSLAILVFKHMNMRRQKDAMLFDLLPTEIADEITVDTVPQFTRHIRSLPSDPGQSFLINRVLRGLEHFRVRRSNPEVASLLGSQGDIDANAVHSSYALVKVFTWAIPILGFIGTVIGISAAVGGFSGDMSKATDIAALKEKLGAVTGGLSTAFDTTLVALVMSLFISILTTALRKSEDDLLNSIDEYCNENLLKRINDDEGQIAAAESSKAIRKAIEQAMTAHHAELRSWTEKLESIGSTLTNEVVDGWTKIFKEIDESQTSQAGAHREQLEQMQKLLAQITERAERVEKDTSASMRVSADSLRGHFEAMTEGITALNRVLGELGEKQIVFQGSPRRGWWPFAKKPASNGD